MYSKEIRTFLCVADCGSFTKAAERMFLTSASVMKQMNVLEGRIGVPLLIRTNQGVQMTAAGRSLYHDAKRILRACGEAVERARTIAAAQRSEIRVGTSLLSPSSVLLSHWERLPEDVKEAYTLKIVPFGDDVEAVQDVLSRLGQEIDVLVGPQTSASWRHGQSFRYLGAYRACCAVSRRHRLAGKAMLSVADLAGETLMMAPPGDIPELDRLREQLTAACPGIRIEETERYFDADVFNGCETERTVLLTFDIWKDIHPSLVTLPVDWAVSLPYGLLYAKDPSPVVSSFIAQMEGAVREPTL